MQSGQLEVTNGSLFHALVQHLKQPLLQITRTAESAKLQTVDGQLSTIEQTAQSALDLIDAYLMSLRLQNQSQLELEPVSVSAVLQKVAYRLAPVAKKHDCDLGIDIGGRFGPVMAEAKILESMILILGTVLLEADAEGHERHQVVLGVHRSRFGIVTGVYTNSPKLSPAGYRRAVGMVGQAGQLLPGMSSASGAGIFVARTLSDALQAGLRPSSHARLNGLATILNPSQQLQLV